MIDSFDISILLPAFAAGVVVLLTHVPLGLEVLRRGIIFIDLAVAQIAGLGVIIAYAAGFDERGLVAQVAAVSCALSGAWLLSLMESRLGRHQEALIGIVFILAASAGILLLANNPHGGEHLREMLVGQILWVQWPQIIFAAFVSIVIASIWLKYAEPIGRVGFYTLFAIAVTLSVQLVGVYLVFASLIVPALAVSLAAVSTPLRSAAAVGVLGYASGLLLSAFSDLPSGAVIVWSIAAIAILFVLVSRRLR
jgi:zinc/manganese transport system permease protein